MKKILSVLVAMALLLACAPVAVAEEAAAAEEVDVLVVGAGGAGMCAAIEAKMAGAEKVLVIDKQEKLLGLTYICEGILSGYQTELAKKHLSDEEQVTAEQCFNQMMNAGKWTADPALTMITAEECGHLIDWLATEVKVPFQDIVEANPSYGPLPLIHYVEGKGAGMREPFLNKLDELGVELRMQNRAVKLVGNDAHDEVVGAIVETPEGEVTIMADAVVLCTGGYADSPEMIGRVAPGNDFIITNRANGPATGDGIIMASEFGAVMHNMEKPVHAPGDYSGNRNGLSATIQLDAQGKRFKNEKAYWRTTQDNHRIAMQSNGVDYFWYVCDAAAVEASERNVKAVENNKNLIVADTIAELAEKTGMDAAVLEETINNWNKYCDQGVDEEWGRDPETFVKVATAPFYAQKVGNRASFTYGGIARNEKGEVMNYRGTNIPGLYVGGEAAVAACENGWTASHAMTWGRIAGRNAAAYAMSK